MLILTVKPGKKGPQLRVSDEVMLSGLNQVMFSAKSDTSTLNSSLHQTTSIKNQEMINKYCEKIQELGQGEKVEGKRRVIFTLLVEDSQNGCVGVDVDTLRAVTGLARTTIKMYISDFNTHVFGQRSGVLATEKLHVVSRRDVYKLSPLGVGF